MPASLQLFLIVRHDQKTLLRRCVFADKGRFIGPTGPSLTARALHSDVWQCQPPNRLAQTSREYRADTRAPLELSSVNRQHGLVSIRMPDPLLAHLLTVCACLIAAALLLQALWRRSKNRLPGEHCLSACPVPGQISGTHTSLRQCPLQMASSPCRRCLAHLRYRSWET
jgi:hypothetical protein